MQFFEEPTYTPELIADIQFWSERLALLRGDNIYDVTRLHFLGRGIHTTQEKLEAPIPHGVKPEVNETHILRLLEEEILQPAGLRFYRTIMGRLICDETRIVGSLVNPSGNSTKQNFDVLGTKALTTYIADRFRALVKPDTTPFMTRLSLTEQGGLTTSLELIPPSQAVSDIKLFYPFLRKTPAELWAEFKASKSAVLLLVGPPGTGKSNFILEMMHARGWDDNVHMADRHDVIINKNLSDYIRNLTGGSVMITEDSDELVRARSQGNENMSALLNATAGIVSKDVKIIISTNLPTLKDVDDAILRPGRCFDVLQFEYLTPDQGQAVRSMLNSEEVDFGNKKSVSLAEAINFHERIDKAISKPAFGMVPA